MTGSTVRDVYRDRIYENEGIPALVALVDPVYRRVLDVGCGNGANMALLVAGGRQVVGETLSFAEATAVRLQGLACVVRDISPGGLTFRPASFDALVFSHVLEHLPFPDRVLRRYVELVRPGGGVYVALPNTLHLVQRWWFLRGRFEYTETGLMDRTHLRFFDFRTARELVEGAGLEVVDHRGVGQCPMGPLREAAPELCRRVDAWTSRHWPALFSIHMIVVGRRPG